MATNQCASSLLPSFCPSALLFFGLSFFLLPSTAATADAFVGVAANGSLLLRPAPGHSVLVNGVDFGELQARVTRVLASCNATQLRACQMVAEPLGTALPGAGERWNHGVAAPNGKIYGIPRSLLRVLVIDPMRDSVDTISIDGVESVTPVTRAWVGGVLFNDVIYGMPFNAHQILIIFTVNDTAKLGPSTASVAGNAGLVSKWAGGALARNNKIYGIPYNANKILVFDPTTGVVTSIASPLTGREVWSGGVLAPTGYIYGIPKAAKSILKIDPAAGTATAVGGADDLGSTWSGGVLGIDGQVYGLPHSSTNLLMFDPATSAIDVSSITCDGGRFAYPWNGGAVARSGLLILAPAHGNAVAIIDPVRRTCDTTSLTLTAWTSTTGQGRFMGAVLGANGQVYLIPNDSDYVYKVRRNCQAL